jgi:hypothetical protein
MSRLVIPIPLVFLVVLAPAPAAPIPKHLPQVPAGYYPTKVGTKLVYDRKGVAETRLVTKVEKADGGTMVTTANVAPDGTQSPHMKVLVNEKGLFLAEEHGSAYDSPWCIFQPPLKPGNTWDTIVLRNRNEILRGRMTAVKEEKIKTPAGEFTTGRVDWEIPQSQLTVSYWYAPQVGLVRQGELVLKSFTLGRD